MNAGQLTERARTHTHSLTSMLPQNTPSVREASIRSSWPCRGWVDAGEMGRWAELQAAGGVVHPPAPCPACCTPHTHTWKWARSSAVHRPAAFRRRRPSLMPRSASYTPCGGWRRVAGWSAGGLCGAGRAAGKPGAEPHLLTSHPARVCSQPHLQSSQPSLPQRGPTLALTFMAGLTSSARRTQSRSSS